MTEVELEKIEAAIGFPLPSEYREVSTAFPFRPIGGDWVYWFYDDPGRVIAATLAPLDDGESNIAGWRKGYLTIGESAAGDLYVMDTTAPGLPVHCLSHETHQLEPEYVTFTEFIEDWMDAPERVERTLEAENASARKEQRVRNRKAFIFVLCAIPSAFVLAALVSWIALWLTR